MWFTHLTACHRGWRGGLQAESPSAAAKSPSAIWHLDHHLVKCNGIESTHLSGCFVLVGFEDLHFAAVYQMGEVQARSWTVVGTSFSRDDQLIYFFRYVILVVPMVPLKANGAWS